MAKCGNPSVLGANVMNAVKGTSASWAITLNTDTFIITTEALTTAAGAEYTLTLTNNNIWADSLVFVTVGKSGSTATSGTPWMWGVTVTANTAVITITNLHASEGFNSGKLLISGFIINPRGT